MKHPANLPAPVTGLIGDCIRNARQKHRLSIAALARRAGISTNGLYDIETHKRSPRMDTVERLGDAMAEPLLTLVMEATLEVKWRL